MQNGEVNLKVLELFNLHVSTNMNSISKLSRQVIEAIENLDIYSIENS